MSEDTGFCPHCGQPMPQPRESKPYGEQGNNKFGLAATVAVHIVLLLLFLFRNHPEKVAAPPLSGAMVLLQPGGRPPKPVPQLTPPKLEVVDIQRLANTITLPHEKPIPVEIQQPEAKPVPPPPAVDMQALIDARRAARAAANGQAVQESDNDRAMRLIKANVAAANGKTGSDRNDSGGMFEVYDKTYHSAGLKFRGWNPNFKRRWLQQLTVDQGTEIDIETAIVKKMIEIIRKEKPGDFIWESHRLGRNVPLSARKEDQAELMAFLYKEMFPEYRPPVR